MTALDVNDGNSDVVYAGGYDVGFWVSRNHGASWSRYQPDYNHKDASGNYDYRKYVWGVGGNGQNVPADIAKHGDGTNISTLLNDPAREAVVWASFSSEQYDAKSGLFKSTDYGETWVLTKIYKNGTELSFDQIVRVHGLSLDKSSSITNRTLYISVDGDIYKSVDDGLTWNNVFLNGGLKFTAVGQTQSGQTVVYAGGENGLYRFVQGGNSWESVGTSEMQASVSPIRTDIVPTYPGNVPPWEGVFDIETDPNISGRVYVTVYGAGKGLYRSNDAGNSWTKIYGINGLENYMRGVAVASQDSDVIYISSSEAYHSGLTYTNSSGIRYSTDGGQTWQDANANTAWNFGGMMEIESGQNPNLWVSVPGTGPQYTPVTSLASVLPPKATLVSPSGSITDNTPTYIWNAVSNATSYYLWVNDSTGNKIKKWYTAAQVGCASGTGTCSRTPSTILSGGAGRWWIQTWNSTGYGPWSSAKYFSLPLSKPAKATLVSPSGNITDSSPDYIWNAVPSSTWYYLWVNDSTGNKIKKWYTAAQAGCASGTGTCLVASSTVLANGAGKWWIQTWNSAGYGLWSNPTNFTVNATASEIAITTVTVPINQSSKNNIIDADINSHWGNDGNFSTAYFELELDGTYQVSKIRYKDDYNRNMTITLDGVVIKAGWTNGAGPSSYAEIIPDVSATGSTLRFALSSSEGAGSDWIVPEDVEVFGTQ